MLCEGMYHPDSFSRSSSKGTGGPLYSFAGWPILLLLAALLLISPSTSDALPSPKRIVSLSPAGTEMLFAMGLGDRVAAVTTFCDHPREALSKPKVGGFADVSIEALISMGADLVVLQDIHSPMTQQLTRAGIRWIMLRQDSVAQVLDSMRALGRACGVPDRGQALARRTESQIRAISSRTKGKRPRVLVCVSREMEAGRITSFYAAGSRSFYGELVRLAGGENCLPPSSPPYPMVFAEGLLAMRPQVVIDLVGDRNFYHSSSRLNRDELFDLNEIRRKWRRSFPNSTFKLQVLEGTVYLRPGPRIPVVIDAFQRAIREASR